MAGRYRFLLLPVLVATPVLPAGAQTVRGLVVEVGTRAPVVGAEVELLTARSGTSPRSTTDSLGEFVVSAPEAGVYRLRVSHPAYRTYQADSIRVGTAETVSVEVRLGFDAVPLDPLVVTARSGSRMAGFDERRRNAGFGRFLVRGDIESRGAPRTTELLRGMSGLTVMPVRRGRTGLLLMRSGLGQCEPAIWVDGHLVDQSPENTVDDFLPPNTLEAVEVYRSSAEAPVEYVTGPCGVILFWTRRGTGEEGHPWEWKKILAGVGAAVGIIILFVH